MPVVLRIPQFEEPCSSDPNRIGFIISRLHDDGNKTSLLPKRTPPTLGSVPVGISVLQVAHSGGCLCQLSVVKPVSRVSESLFPLVLSCELHFAKEHFVCRDAIETRSSLPLGTHLLALLEIESQGLPKGEM